MATQGDVKQIPPVVDNLTSTSTTNSLSANQGKVLKGLIDGFIKTENKTGTTDSNGNLLLDTTGVQKRCVLFVWDGAHIFIPFYYSGKWYARAQVTDPAGTAVTNTSLSVSMYYL